MQDRRRFLWTALMGAAGAAMGGSRGRVSAAESGPGGRPNVLFIAIDDLNDWVGCLGGHPDVKTPNMDRLASRGVLFTHAYCSAPACNPSRASLLTGIRPSTSGVYHNDQPWRPVMRDAVTLQQHFMAHGYEVVGRGKIFHGGFNDEASWHEYIPVGASPEPPNRPVNGIPNTAQFDWGPVDCTDEDMNDTRVVQWAGEYLGRKHEKPFFLAAGITRPHLPWYVPRKYFEMYPLDKITLPNVKENDLDDVPEAGRRMARPEGDHKKVIDTNNWRRAVQGYLASITFVDGCIGRLIEAFDRSAYRDNTIVILWGDHGWHLGEKLHWRKFALWEEATRAPLMLVAPGVTRPESRCARTVNFIDIYPTLADLCALPPRRENEGVSLRPLLADPGAAWDRPSLTTHGRLNHSVRSERWRYIRYADGSEELYDHEKDELEWTNLANNTEFADVKKELAAWLPKSDAPDAARGKGQQKKAKKAKPQKGTKGKP